MTAARRFVVLDGGLARQGNDDLQSSFATATRRGDVIGALRRAAQAPRRGHRSSKIGGALLTPEAIRAEQIAACKAALDEIDIHGVHRMLTAALAELVPVLVDVKVRSRLLRALENRGVEPWISRQDGGVE